MKTLKALLSLSLLLSLTACGQKNEEPQTPEVTDNETEQQDFSQFAWGEYIEEGDFVSTTPTGQRGLYLDLFEEFTYVNPDQTEKTITVSSYNPDTGESFTQEQQFTVGNMTYYVYDPIKNGADPEGTYPVVYWFHGSGNALDGKQAISSAGAEFYASKEAQEVTGPCYIICPLANETNDPETGATIGNWMTAANGETTTIYHDALAGIMAEFLAANGDHVSKTVIAGTSAGGYCAWRYIIDHTEEVSAALLMAPAYTPTDEELKAIDEAGIDILYMHARHDELVQYDAVTAPIIDKLNAMEHVHPLILDWARNGDGGIASLFFGIEMGQHCICVQVGQNLMFDDGTPMTKDFPTGLTEWFKEVYSK